MDVSVRVGGILGLPGPLPSLSREEISVNDIQEGAASQPDSFLERQDQRSVSKFLGKVKSHAGKLK